MIRNNRFKNSNKKNIESLLPIYLLTGENNWKIEKSISRLKMRFSDDSERELSFQQFDFLKVSVDDILNVCKTLPFLSQKRLVVARNVHKLSNDELEKIIEYAKSPSPYCCLVLIAETVWDNSNLKNSTRKIRDKLKNFIGKMGKVYDFRPISFRGLESWVRERCRERGVRINPAAVYLLTNFLGNDLWNLESEVEKLALYVGKREVIDQETVQLLVAGNPEINIFKFLDYLSEKKESEAYSSLRSIFFRTKPVKLQIESLRILGTMRWHFKRLLKIKSLIEKKIDTKQMEQILPAKSFAIKKLKNQQKNFSKKDLRNCLFYLLKADEGIKRGKQKAEIILETLVSKILNV